MPNIKKHYDDVLSATKEYKNVILLDYQKAYFGKNFLFRGSYHMNPHGAEIFSREVYGNLKGYNLT